MNFKYELNSKKDPEKVAEATYLASELEKGRQDALSGKNIHKMIYELFLRYE